MYVRVISNRYLEDLNKEIEGFVKDATAKGWRVTSATTTVVHMSGKETLAWNGVVYTTTIVLDASKKM